MCVEKQKEKLGKIVVFFRVNDITMNLNAFEIEFIHNICYQSFESYVMKKHNMYYADTNILL